MKMKKILKQGFLNHNVAIYFSVGAEFGYKWQSPFMYNCSIAKLVYTNEE